MAELKAMTGQRFGKLLVIERAADYISPRGDKIVRWRCKCDCGSEKIARGKDLREGRVNSCGCGNPIRRKTITKENGGKCLYNRAGILCDDQKCSKCGWNPCNKKLREERLEKLKERMP